MFLQKMSKRLYTANTLLNYNGLRCIASGSSETAMIDKWKQKFRSENISEIDNSIKHILEHVIHEQKEVIILIIFY